MRARHLAVCLVAAALVAGPAVSGAVADSGAGDRSGASVSSGKVAQRAAARADRLAERIERKAAKRKHVVLGGKVLSVEGQSLTFTVHGGRYKALRGTDVTVTVAEDAKVTREGRAALTDVVAGDKVVVKSRAFEVTGTKHAELLVSATVHRVVAAPRVVEPETTTDPATTSDPATPTG